MNLSFYLLTLGLTIVAYLFGFSAYMIRQLANKLDIDSYDKDQKNHMEMHKNIEDKYDSIYKYLIEINQNLGEVKGEIKRLGS